MKKLLLLTLITLSANLASAACNDVSFDNLTCTDAISGEVTTGEGFKIYSVDGQKVLSTTSEGEEDTLPLNTFFEEEGDSLFMACEGNKLTLTVGMLGLSTTAYVTVAANGYKVSGEMFVTEEDADGTITSIAKESVSISCTAQ